MTKKLPGIISMARGRRLLRNIARREGALSFQSVHPLFDLRAVGGYFSVSLNDWRQLFFG
jgi:hypothetical protein